MAKDKKAEAKQKVIEIVKRFKLVDFKKYGSSEFELQIKFINELFEILGWDVRGKKDFDEVRFEPKIYQGRADYVFKIGGIPKFALEAKKISINIDDPTCQIQAVMYAYNMGLTYAALTNFKRLIVFNAEEEEKDLEKVKVLDLTCDEFVTEFDKLWWLSKEGINKGILDKEAEQRGAKKKRIPLDKQLFEDLLFWRNKLYTNIKKNNLKVPEPEIEENIQIFLNRLIFIRHCEDKDYCGYVLKEKIHLWESGKKYSLMKSLQDIFKIFDTDYNSELFKERTLDSLIIDDTVIKEIIYDIYHSRTHSIAYRFDAIRADTLGNVYEQFLGNIQKRKAQGIYYTPTYVVDFIVRHTLGGLLNEKNVNPDRIKFLDPACGSGSFLIKAIDYFIEFHKKKRDIKQQVLNFKGEGVSYSKKADILIKNIFGVDLDAKAIDIARLNLLLHIAQKKEKLPLLKENLKVGNSLIDDEEVAGKGKAFKWQEQFKEIMQDGGFDVVIGNPPYISWNKINHTERKAFESGAYLDVNYICRPNHGDSQPNYYLFFIVRSKNLLSENGILSFIIPQEWLYHNYAKDFRNYLLDKFDKIQILQFNPNFKVFRSLNKTVGTNSLIIILYKKGNKKITHYYIDELNETKVKEIIRTESFSKKIIRDYKNAYNSLWTFSEANVEKIRNKIINLKDIIRFKESKYFEVKGGFQPPVNKAKLYEIDENEYKHLEKNEQQLVFPLIYDAKEIKRYNLYQKIKKFWIVTNDISSEEDLKKNYPHLHHILSKRLNTKQKFWWCFPNIRNFKLIKKYPVKLMSPRTASKPSFILDEDKSVFKGTNTMIISKLISPSYLIAILNSKLSDFWYSHFGYEYHGGKTKKYEPAKAEEYLIPIKQIPEPQQQPIIKLVDKMLSLNKRLNELGDKKTDERARIEEEIKKTDVEIDELVYKIYGITDKEKKIIEESLR